MKKLIFIVLFVPFITHAAWWNPLSWFDTQESFVATSSPEIVEVPTPIIVEKQVEVPVEKPVIKEVIRTETITVPDPTTYTRINELIADNSALRSQLRSIQSELGQCRITLGQQSSVDEYQEELSRKDLAEQEALCESATVAYNEANQDKFDLQAEYNAELEAIRLGQANGKTSPDSSYPDRFREVDLRVQEAMQEQVRMCNL